MDRSQEYAKTQIKGEIKPVERAVFNKFWRPDSTWIAKGKRFKVAELRANRISYARPDKFCGIQWLGEVFPEAVQRILAGEHFTIDSFQKLGYCDYLKAHLHPSCNQNGIVTQGGLEYIWSKKFVDLERLCHSIKREGLKAPLDMYMDKECPILIRGYRRLEILHQLGRTNVAVRVWRNEWLAEHHIPMEEFDDEGVHGHAIKQFVKYGYKATDKYWVHGYTPYYGFMMRGQERAKLRILELGVKDGMSLKLWKDSFPRAQIFGVDKELLIEPEDRIYLLKGDVNDIEFLDNVGKVNGPFDLIIDDASHRPDPQRSNFNTLWKHVNDNGVYAVEDLHPNYRNIHMAHTAMPTFEKNIDNIWTDHTVKSVNFYPNICFIRKA